MHQGKRLVVQTDIVIAEIGLASQLVAESRVVDRSAVVMEFALEVGVTVAAELQQLYSGRPHESAHIRMIVTEAFP